MRNSVTHVPIDWCAFDCGKFSHTSTHSLTHTRECAASTRRCARARTHTRTHAYGRRQIDLRRDCGFPRKVEHSPHPNPQSHPRRCPVFSFSPPFVSKFPLSTPRSNSRRNRNVRRGAAPAANKNKPSTSQRLSVARGGTNSPTPRDFHRSEQRHYYYKIERSPREMRKFSTQKQFQKTRKRKRGEKFSTKKVRYESGERLQMGEGIKQSSNESTTKQKTTGGKRSKSKDRE